MRSRFSTVDWLPAPMIYQRFQDEARLIATLRHPHILPITDFDRDESGVPFFVMDLLEGESLAQRLKHRETLPFAQAMDLLSQVGSALHAAHRSGIVHRNLRPENIFLVRHDLGDRVVETTKITDFGLACFRRPPGTSRDLPPSVYNAPELLQEGAAIDGRADQWALAALAYRLLSGKSPFEEGTPEETMERIINEAPRPLGKLMPDLPPHVVAAIHRGMARRRRIVTRRRSISCERLARKMRQAVPWTPCQKIWSHEPIHLRAESSRRLRLRRSPPRSS
jgi:serine/threonine protein kinase